jgi:multiple sugar transport system substrate-binding protein
MVNTTKLGELGLEVPDTWTWEEFAEFANTVHDASDGRLHGAEDGTTGSVLESFLIQRGYPGVYDGASIAPSEEDFVDWFRYWADLRASGGTVTAEINAAFDGAHPNNPVVKGQAAIGMQFNITEEVWATLTVDVFDYGMYPSSTDLTGNYVKPAALFSVNAATKHPEEAVEFISTFISDSDVSKALALTRGLPNAEALKALEGTLTDKQRAFVGFGELVAAGQLSDAPTAPTGSGDVTALLTKYAGEVAFGNRDAAAGAKQFYAEATAVPLGG